MQARVQFPVNLKSNDVTYTYDANTCCAIIWGRTLFASDMEEAEDTSYGSDQCWCRVCAKSKRYLVKAASVTQYDGHSLVSVATIECEDSLESIVELAAAFLLASIVVACQRLFSVSPYQWNPLRCEFVAIAVGHHC